MTRLIPFSWIGSKIGMLPHLLPLFPEHHCYVDVFGGSAAVLLNKRPVPVEIYNDLDSGLVNFFEVIRNPETFRRFQEQVKWMVSSRELHNRFKATWDQQADPVERAIRWWYVAATSFAGKWGKGWRIQSVNSETKIGSIPRTVFKLSSIHTRLAKIQVEHRDARELIPMYDNPRVLFYLDPPYAPDVYQGGGYVHDTSDTLHTDLVKILLSIQGMAILSGYETPLYEPLLEAGWKMYRFHRPAASQGRTRNSGLQGAGTASGPENYRIECVYVNPAAQAGGQGELF